MFKLPGLIVSVAVLAFATCAELNEREFPCNAKLGCHRLDQQYYDEWLCNASHSEPIQHECSGFQDVQTEYKRRVILDIHNVIRRRPGRPDNRLSHLPVPANMWNISYDVELEAMAYEWATRCYPVGYNCYDVTHGLVVGRNSKVSESINPIGDVDPIFDIEDWFNSGRSDLNTDNYTFNESSSPLAQMLYDKTVAIGCAEVKYDVLKDNFKHKRRLVCFYLAGIGPGTWTLYEHSRQKENATTRLSQAVKRLPANRRSRFRRRYQDPYGGYWAKHSDVNGFQPILGRYTTPSFEYEPDVEHVEVYSRGIVNEGKFALILATTFVLFSEYMQRVLERYSASQLE